MTTRISIKSDIRPLQGYKDLLMNSDKAVEAIVAVTVHKHGATYLRPLRDLDPGPSRHGAQAGAWSTDPAADARARRWFFANYPNGYVRTGGLGRAWTLMAQANRAILENPAKAAAYVFSVARRITGIGGRPNPGHVRTGWQREGTKTAEQVVKTLIADVRLGWVASIAASKLAGFYRIVVP